MSYKIQNLCNPSLKDQLENIWAQYTQLGGHKMVPPLYQDADVCEDVITFLSLNPSDPTTTYKSYSMIDFKEKPKHPFFDKFYEITKSEKILLKNSEQNWSILDLLYIRDSDQKQIEDLYKEDTGKMFITQQADLTLEILEKIRPKLVIVVNASVEHLLISNPAFVKGTNHPDDSNSNIYRYKDIPFIMRESKFMGSRIKWYSKSKNATDRKEKLYAEINRVLSFI